MNCIICNKEPARNDGMCTYCTIKWLRDRIYEEENKK